MNKAIEKLVELQGQSFALTPNILSTIYSLAHPGFDSRRSSYNHAQVFNSTYPKEVKDYLLSQGNLKLNDTIYVSYVPYLSLSVSEVQTLSRLYKHLVIEEMAFFVNHDIAPYVIVVLFGKNLNVFNEVEGIVNYEIKRQEGEEQTEVKERISVPAPIGPQNIPGIVNRQLVEFVTLINEALLDVDVFNGYETTESIVHNVEDSKFSKIFPINIKHIQDMYVAAGWHSVCFYPESDTFTFVAMKA